MSKKVESEFISKDNQSNKTPIFESNNSKSETKSIPYAQRNFIDRIIRNRADFRTLFIFALTWTIYSINWFYVYEIKNPYIMWPVSLFLNFLNCVLFFCCAVANHNIVHTPVFYKKYLNSIVNVILTISYGHPSSSYVPGHNLSHHKFTQTRKDFMRTSKVSYKWNFLNGLLFFFVIMGDVFRNDVGYFKVQRQLDRPIYRQVRLEIITMFLFQAFWLFNGGVFKFLILLYLPQLFAKWGITTINLVQHDGCAMSSSEGFGKYNSARNFTGSILNWWTMNNGYHMIHHLHPAMHWSILPAKHEELVKPHMHPNLEYESMTQYIIETYFYPCKRLNYDGTPYTPLHVGEDEEWFFGERETHSDIQFGDKYM